jgi:hypothetical protein
MARIVWTNVEKGAVFTRMMFEFLQRPLLTRKEALRLAQSVLPSDRWVVITDQRVHTYRDRIDIARQKALQESRKKPEKPVETPAAILAPPPAPERKESTTERLAQAFERLLDIVADAVAQKVAERLTPPISREELTRHVNQQFGAEFAKYPRPRHDPRPIPHPTGQAKPGVLVIGLLPTQVNSVSLMVGHQLDLTCYTAEMAVNRPPLVRAHTVLMTKFISHVVQEKYRKSPRLHFCNGGVSELVAILDSIVAPVV